VKRVGSLRGSCYKEAVSAHDEKTPEHADLPLDCLSDAIASIGQDDRLTPCNAPMRQLLEELSVATLADLPLGAEVAEQLEAGHLVAMATGEGPCECRLVSERGRRWLLVARLPDRQRALCAELAASRLRSLGGLANAIVHELANQMLAGLGMAETLRPHIRDAADAETLDVLQHGIRRGTVLSRALATQLGRKPATWQVMPVSKIIDDVVAIGHKHAVRCGIEIESRIDSDASVRLDAAEGVHGVMQVLLFCVSRSVSKISVVCSVGPASIAGGRDREVARIKITGSPVSAEVSEFVVSVLTDNEGVLRAFGDSQSEDSGLVQAAIAAARAGGQLTVTAVDEGVAFDFVWPSV